MKITKELEAEIRVMMDDYWDSYFRGDLDHWENYLVDDYRNIGGTEEEIWNSKREIVEYTHRVIDQMMGLTEIRNKQMQIIPYDGYLMVHEFLEIFIKIEENWTFYGKFRLSTLIQKIAGAWKVLHQHGSYPDAHTEQGEAFAFDTLRKENTQLREAVKRRTIELEQKTLDLQLEAALEKVRSSALAMNEPKDMVEVCRVISDQLLQLGVEDIRNVQTVIINEHKGTYLNYQFFAAYEKGVIEETAYNHHPTVFAMVQEMKKSANSTFSGSMEGKELITFREWRKQNNQFSDPLLDEVESLHYYFYSIGRGGLGLSTYKPISDEGHEIFKRFHNVFTLAYRRFTDIELALAQAREAQIEASVERVRAQSMAMHHTSDLYKVNEEVLNQLYKLKVDGLTGVSIYLVDKNDIVTVWDLSSPGNMSIPNSYSLKYDAKKYPIMGEWVEIWKSSNQDYFVLDFPKEKLKQAVEELKEIHPEMAINFKTAIESGKLNHQWNPVGILSDGILAIDLMNSPSDDTKNIVLKIAGAFNMAYQRFLDLQKAEAQSREAQLELSLERIRAQVTSMRESTELLDIVVNMRNEFVSLGHEAHYFWHMRWLPDKYEKAMTSGDGTRIGMVMSLPRHIHGDVKLVADWEKSDEPTIVFAMDKETAVDYVRKMITLGDFQQVDPQAPTLDDIQNLGGLTFVMARTTHGEIGFSLPGNVPDPPQDAVETLKRFARVFDLAYKRFEDLKTAEKDLIEIKAAKQKAEEALTELKATQTQLVQQEKLASLGQLTAGIAHEIKNPLNFVNNFSEVSIELIEEALDEILQIETNPHATDTVEILGDIKFNLEKIHEHGSRANGIVSSMLLHSRGGSGKMEPSDLNALIREYVNLAFHGMRAGKNPINVTIDLQLDEQIGEVALVVEDFSRVLLNLCNNAFDAMRETAPSRPTRLIVRTKLEMKQVLIEVEDNGPGIPEEIKDKILQPFFTTKKGTEGTGLGLSISHDIVKAHGGELTVDSTVGEGTTFIIRIPFKN